MIIKLLNLFRKYWVIIVLILIEILLFIFNYKPGTYLAGWDNLYPELNFSANLKRNLFSVWQEYRGLGLLDGMAFAANLPHTLFLWLFHFILPQSFLRYFFIFFMHFLGGVGFYLLVSRTILKNSPNIKLFAFLGSLFYLFNLAVIQMFYAPLEVFAVHFAFLPWLTFFLLQYLESSSKRNLFLFILFSIFSLPQGFVPQIFIVYLILVFFLLLAYVLSRKPGALKKAITILFIIFAINSFWIFPYLYSIPKNSSVIINAKINQMSSEDIYQKNKERGNLSDVIFLRGFMLDVSEYSDNDVYGYIMQPWRTIQKENIFKISEVFFLLLWGIGVIISLIKKNKNLLPFLLSSMFAFFFLGGNIPGLGFLNEIIREKIPILGEAFRFPFTKFSILFSFCYSIFLIYGLSELFIFLKKYLTRYAKFLIILFILLFGFYIHPVVNGNFIFDKIRYQIPKEHLQTIEFFKKQNINTRILILPQPSFWNWRFQTGGYRGSGYFWYGLEQPVLDRAFDPWSKQNENFYWELSLVLDSQNIKSFESLLDKYAVNWLVIDENIINPSSAKALLTDEIMEMVKGSQKFNKVEEAGKIKIYQVYLNNSVNNFIEVGNNWPSIGPIYQWGNLDKAYTENNNYITENSSFSQIYYPFRSLFTNKTQKDLEFSVEETNDSYIIKNKLPAGITTDGYHLVLPAYDNNELVWIDPITLNKRSYYSTQVMVKDDTIEVEFPKVGGYLSTEILPDRDLPADRITNCGGFGLGIINNQIISDSNGKYLQLESKGAVNCSAAFWLSTLSHDTSYLISVKSKNVKGKSLSFWLENLNLRKAEMETYLPKDNEWTNSYLIQPQIGDSGLSYSLHFDNISYGHQESINDLGKISVNPIPFKYLMGIKFVSKDFSDNKISVSVKDFEVNHPLPFFYKTTIFNNQEESILSLSQSFNSGWVAIGNKGILTDHVLVNNWANGWVLPTTSDQRPETVYIIYWPQILEFLGFGLGIITLLYLLKPRHDPGF